MALNIRIDGPIDAPALLFSNSIGCDLSMWRPILPMLAGRYRVIRYDARGHGASASVPGEYAIADLADDALSVLDAAGVARAHVCGLSLGGVVAQAMASRAPERIDRLILANTAARIGTAEAWEGRRQLVLALGMGEIADMAMTRFFSPRFRAAEADQVAGFRANLLATAPDGYAGCCAALRDADMTALLSGIAAPTMVIGGVLDVSTPPAQAEALAQGLPRSRLVLLDAAHLSNVEQPQGFAAALIAHLETE